MELTVVKENQFDDWNNFIKSNADFPTIAHNPILVKIIQKSFNWEGWNYFLEDNGNRIGAVNLIDAPGGLTSMPHFSYSGLTANKGINKKGLYENLEKSLDAKLEIRDTEPLSSNYNDNKVTSYKELIPDVDDQLMELSSNQRRKVRKSYKNGIELRKGDEYLDKFYEIYTLNMHGLGSPPLPKYFFETILDNYEYGPAEIFCAEYDGEIIGGGFLLGYQNFYENCWFSTLREYNSLYSSLFLYWEMIKFSIEDGATIFSLGRSTKDSSLHRFKSHWGTKDKQLYFNYNFEKGFNIKNFDILSSIWSKIPKKVADRVGPYFAKKIY